MSSRKLNLIVVSSLLFASTALQAQTPATRAFERMKALEGVWEGKMGDGHLVSETFQPVSDGASLMSQLTMDEPMVSMFYMDGGQLMMTHFCPSKNQPRMRATISPDGNTITFNFVDATNLATPETGHMYRAVYILGRKDRLAEQWTWRQNGKETTMQFELHRKQ
jgi:hypothetical protein